jgi:hypothetical protein
MLLVVVSSNDVAAAGAAAGGAAVGGLLASWHVHVQTLAPRYAVLSETLDTAAKQQQHQHQNRVWGCRVSDCFAHS